MPRDANMRHTGERESRQPNFNAPVTLILYEGAHP